MAEGLSSPSGLGHPGLGIELILRREWLNQQDGRSSFHSALMGDSPTLVEWSSSAGSASQSPASTPPNDATAFPSIYKDLTFQRFKIILLSTAGLKHPSLVFSTVAKPFRPSAADLQDRACSWEGTGALDEDQGTLYGESAVLDNLIYIDGKYPQQQQK
ncbi:hypothetical protein FRC16_004489 [Serendipita sp. 398]|nr:hypothetical protein FRC16_004489 [Serendipita sp. 398]